MVKNSSFLGTIYDVAPEDDGITVSCLDAKASMQKTWKVKLVSTNYQLRPGDSLAVSRGVASWTTAQADFAAFKRKRHDRRVGRERLSEIRIRVVNEPSYVLE